MNGQPEPLDAQAVQPRGQVSARPADLDSHSSYEIHSARVAPATSLRPPGVGSVGFLGPPGTFTHRTLLLDPALSGLRHVPMTAAEDVVAQVVRGSVAQGVLPWENSVAGVVGPTVDLLAGVSVSGRGGRRPGVYLHRDVVLPVGFQLVAHQGATLRGVREVTSHPHALGQCGRWLRRRLPGAPTVAAHSTMAAFDRALADPAGRIAAVVPMGPPPEGTQPPVVLATAIGDHPEAETRFVVLARERPRGQDKLAGNGRVRTVLACFQSHDRPGSLLEILEPFATLSLDLLRIESRPTRHGLGRYYFVIECLAHWQSEELSLVRALLAVRGIRVRVLGELAEPAPHRLGGVTGAAR